MRSPRLVGHERDVAAVAELGQRRDVGGDAVIRGAGHEHRPRLRVRDERRDDIHQALLDLGCIRVCWHLLQ